MLHRQYCILRGLVDNLVVAPSFIRYFGSCAMVWLGFYANSIIEKEFSLINTFMAMRSERGARICFGNYSELLSEHVLSITEMCACNRQKRFCKPIDDKQVLCFVDR